MSKQRNNGTGSDRQAVEIVRTIARTGSLNGRLRAACARISQEFAVLGAVTRLGYLAERHIAESTGIEKGLTGIVESLCETDQLQPITVADYDSLYWVRPGGVRAVGRIELPIGSLDLAAMATKSIRDFARVGVKDPLSMKHLIAIADLTTRLDSHYTGVVLGERAVRLAEGVLGRFGTFETNHCPDAVVISPSGKVTAVEIECSPHDSREDEVACGALKRSPHIGAALYVAFDKETHNDVLRRVRRTEVMEKAPATVTVLACEPGKLPALKQMRPAGVSPKRRTARPRTRA